MPTSDTSTAPGLPPLCYARQPETGATVLIVRGEAGCHPVETSLTPEQLNTALAKPPTDAQVQALLVGSMFGWDTRGTDTARHAGAHPRAGNATTEPLPLFPIVAHWGGPDTPFRLMWRSPVYPRASPSLDPFWAYAGQDLGYYGWLRMADQQARQAFSCGLLDLPPRDWREMYNGRVPPIEAADVAIDEHAAQHGTGPAPIPRPVAPTG